MKRYRILIALGALLLPLIVRGVWFYRGIYQPVAPVFAPNYVELTAPTPPTGAKQAEVEQTEPIGKIVLLDWAHDNQFEITELEGFIEELITHGAQIEIVQGYYSDFGLSLDERLKYASAYIVIAPNEVFSDDDIHLLSRFVDRGGRLLVISDPTRSHGIADLYDLEYSYGYSMGGVMSANSLLSPFDLSFSDNYLYNLLHNEGNYRNVLFSTFGDDSITEDLTAVAFYGVSSIDTNTGTPLIIGDRNTLSSITDMSGEWAAAARSQNGGVIALGDLTFLTPPYDQVADNPLFISRLVAFLLGGERLRDLSDYPFIFEQPVAILKSETFDLTADTLQTISGLESILDAQDLPLTLVDEPSPGLDLIIFSSYTPTEDIQPFLEPFEDLVLPEDTEDGALTVPGFGEMEPSGIGLMLLARSEERTTLILLAASGDDLLTLADILTYGDLSGCLIREQAAVCWVSSGEGFMFDDEFDYDETYLDFDDLYGEDYYTDDTFFPTPTPTP